MVVKKATTKLAAQQKETFKRETRILGEVQRYLMRRITESDAARDVDHIHPSEICKKDWCPRQTYFRISGEPVTDVLPPNNPFLENVFDEGHDIHAKWQVRLWEMGVLAGNFLCLHCRHVWWTKSPTTCKACGSKALTYAEVPLVDKEYHLVGHADGLIVDDKGEALIEVKSIGLGTIRLEAPRLFKEYSAGKTLQQVWNEIRHPFPTHLRQGMLYCFFTGVPEIVFLYEFKANQMVKEFVIPFQQDLIAVLLQEMKDLKLGLRRGFPPMRPDFANNADARVCKACPYRRGCWEIETEDAADSEPVTVRRIKRTREVA